jgi:hypothetical protein
MTTALLWRQGHKRQLAIKLNFQKPLFDTTRSRTLKNRRDALNLEPGMSSSVGYATFDRFDQRW